MKTTRLELFPTLFYEFIFTQDELNPLCKEIENKKEEIKKIYNDDAFEPEVDDYWTDFRNPIELLEYERIMMKIPPQFVSYKLNCEHDEEYWSAIYGERGYHKTHHHTENLYSGVSHRCNMSSVLYLSDIGGTMFWNPRISSDEIQTSIFIPSEVGKMVMWPSHILHEVIPHGEKNVDERIVVSSNWRLQQQQQQ